MSNIDEVNLKSDLKNLIVTVCNLQVAGVTPEDIEDNDPLFGPMSPITIDSLDAVEIVAALEKKYSVYIRDKNTSHEVLQSINTISDFIIKENSK